MQALIIGGLFGALGGMLYVLPVVRAAGLDGALADLLLLHRAAARRRGHGLRAGAGLGDLLLRPHLHQGHRQRLRARQHHERPADRAVLLHRRRCRADAARDLPTARESSATRGSSGSMSESTAARTSTTDVDLADPAARRALMAGVDPTPGSPKPDPILVVDNIIRHFGGMTAVDVEPPRGAARHHHRADRAQRCRQDDVLQPDHRVRQADLGQDGRALVLRRAQARQDLGLQRRQGRAWSGPSSSPRR